MAVAKTAVNVMGTGTGSRQNIGTSASVTSSSVDCSTYAGMVLRSNILFGASAADNVTIEVLSSDDDTNFDTVAYTPFTMDEVVSSTEQKSWRLGPEIKYLKVKVTNNDAADDIDVWLTLTGMTV